MFKLFKTAPTITKITNIPVFGRNVDIHGKVIRPSTIDKHLIVEGLYPDKDKHNL